MEVFELAFFTKDWFEQMQDAHLLTLPESDEEWADYIRSFEENGEDVHAYLRNQLERIKIRLLTVLPEEFHSFIEDGSINQPYLPKEVKEQLLKWSIEMERKYKSVGEHASNHFESLRDQIPENFVKLREARLHDARILHIARKDNAIRLTIDSSGSFNIANRIVLTFKNVKEERSDLPLEEGQHWLYEEVDIHEDGAVFGVLVDCPLTQWMVVAENVIIEQYYKTKSLPVWQDEEAVFGASAEEIARVEKRLQVTFPSAYSELLAEQNGGQLTHYLIATAETVVDVGRLFSTDKLVRDGEFVWIGENVALKFSKDMEPVVVYRNVGQLARNFEQFLECCVSTEYIDEYAIFSVPLADEELEPALFGDDLELMVRAWNMLFERPGDFVSLIEKGLLFLSHRRRELTLDGLDKCIYF